MITIEGVDLLSVREAAKRLPWSERGVLNRIRSGAIAARKVGTDWYITAQEVERLRAEIAQTVAEDL